MRARRQPTERKLEEGVVPGSTSLGRNAIDANTTCATARNEFEKAAIKDGEDRWKWDLHHPEIPKLFPSRWSSSELGDRC